MQPIPAASLFLVLTLAGGAPARADEFTPGSLYVHSGLLDDGSGPYPGVARLDPFTGEQHKLVQYASNIDYFGSVAYDPSRDRLVALAPIETGSLWLYALDSQGGWVRLASTFLARLSPRGDGKVYGHTLVGPDDQKLFYLDAANQVQTLMDDTGGAPYLLNPGGTMGPTAVSAMIYDPGTNALLIASAGDNQNGFSCSGGTSFDISIHKIPLSADGTRVAGPAECTTYDVDPTPNAGETPLEFSRGPAGQLVLSVHTVLGGARARLLSVDPATAQASPFAVNGPYVGDGYLDGGAYSPLTGRAIVLDDFNHVLRQFHPGESGDGTILAASLDGGLSMTVVGPIGPTPTLTADRATVSISQAGTQKLTFTPGPAYAGDLYYTLGSITGWTPGFSAQGVTIPLDYDAYTSFTIQHPNSALLSHSLGYLDVNGTAGIQFHLPSGLPPGLVGFTLYHAAIVFSPGILLVSNPVPLTLVQ